MNGALILALPGLLCAVMAWDLARPGVAHPYRPIEPTGSTCVTRPTAEQPRRPATAPAQPTRRTEPA